MLNSNMVPRPGSNNRMLFFVVAGISSLLLITGIALLGLRYFGFFAPVSPTGTPVPTTGGIPSPTVSANPNSPLRTSENAPDFTITTVLDGLSNPWDIGMFADGSFIFTEKPNRINYFENGEVTLLASPADTFVKMEGGMLSLAIDPDFQDNSYIYTCFNTKQGSSLDVRIARWSFNKQAKTLSDRTDILTGLPAKDTGRHSGCQLEFGPDGFLWVGTGDAANGLNPQSPVSLGGKILRIDRDGKPAPGNLASPFDSRIFSYGHRNSQGLAFFAPELGFSVPGISIEHGSGVDDEVNPLVPGNFGWDPPASYDEGGVPMTDLNKFPDAVKAIWSSGNSTIATSGGTVIQGEQWLGWQNSIAFAAQKGSRIVILQVDRNLSIQNEFTILRGEYGRLRTIQSLSDGNLYILTDNGSGKDKILRLTAK